MQRRFFGILVFCIVIGFGSIVGATAPQTKELQYAKDGSQIPGYKDTPIQPWSGYHVHDPDHPAPPLVEPGHASLQERVGSAPSDAIVLFDGTNLSQWLLCEWEVKNGHLVATEGALTTRENFRDFQLHLEWRAPNPPTGRPFDRGNSGVMLMGLFEIQIFDSYSEKIYPDGQAASVYGQTPPLVNACRPPGLWQTYDIIFTAPVFKVGQLIRQACVSMLHNGVLVHHNTAILGRTLHRELGYYPESVSEGPITLTAHNNPVEFRNIWIRPL